MNDTHPALAIPELMRIFVDEKKMDWDKVFAYQSLFFLALVCLRRISLGHIFEGVVNLNVGDGKYNQNYENLFFD